MARSRILTGLKRVRSAVATDRPRQQISARCIRSTAARSGRAMLELLLPPRCVWCQAESDEMLDGFLLCTECQQQLAGTVVSRCPRCGAAGMASDAGTCMSCSGRRLRFDHVVPLGSYSGVLRECVLTMKRPRHEPLSAAMAELLFARQGIQLSEAKADAVLPVPMHWMRRIVRRANSPELIADRLATRLGVPLLHRALRRVRYTRRQGPMLRTQRLANVQGAFRLQADAQIRGKRLILVDDVLTSGATCDEVAKVLKRAGVASVTVAVLARADSIR
jgi:ComF family protein